MNTLNFSENIIKLRHQKKVTQEQLANFIGVTKASVSKWETKQSLPDVLLLPQLAAYFGVTIDELLGYELQLSKAQIEKFYGDFAADFAEKPFEEVMERSRGFVKKYYSCYPFLFRMCCLWLNHFMLADTTVRQMEVLAEISELCCHIISNCKEIVTCNDAVMLKAVVDLQLGKPQEVIEVLEEVLKPGQFFGQSEAVLTQAYQLVGENEKANSFTQINMYLHLLSLVGNSTQYLTIHSMDLEICEETIGRVEKLIETYDLEKLHPNITAQFLYQAAIVCCIHGKMEEALEKIKRYAVCVVDLLDSVPLILHGDSYFDAIDKWFEENALDVRAPREKKVIFDSVVQSLNHPVFAVLENEKEYQNIKKVLVGKGEVL